MNVVIDSLSRSGTTLFTSILNTNKDITATRGIFNECLSQTVTQVILKGLTDIGLTVANLLQVQTHVKLYVCVIQYIASLYILAHF